MILHIIASVDPRGGGPIEGVVQQALKRTGPDFDVQIASLDAPDDPWVLACPVKVFALGQRRNVNKAWAHKIPWYRYGYQSAIVPWLKQNISRYDVVVVNGLWNYATMAARRALVGSGVPYVVFTHGMLDPWFKKVAPFKSLLKQIFWLFCEGPLLNSANYVLFTTEDERIVSRRAFLPYRIQERVVGYGTADIAGDAAMQIKTFRQALSLPDDRRYLLYLSRIHPKKGVDDLIRAFGEAASNHPGLDLVIAGPDQTEWIPALKEIAKTYGVESRIHWPGMLTGDAKWGAYRGCEAFILPSHQENFGIVVAEALSAGKPVLISNKVQIWREVADAQAGFVDTDDLGGTIRLVRQFIDWPKSEADMAGERARKLFLEKFEIKIAVKSINDALSDAAAPKLTI
ncbi:glycosyl transferase [Prosthecomicrobium hirschii]|nr:glycosyl transferase [Prosthecomicrobium hirschii]